MRPKSSCSAVRRFCFAVLSLASGIAENFLGFVNVALRGFHFVVEVFDVPVYNRFGIFAHPLCYGLGQNLREFRAG